MNAVTVTKAALHEAGRPDLADGVYATSEGWPAHLHVVLRPWEKDLLLKAFVLGHEAVGHHVEVGWDDLTGHYLRWER